jgi:hypothetical protein
MKGISKSINLVFMKNQYSQHKQKSIIQEIVMQGDADKRYNFVYFKAIREN